MQSIELKPDAIVPLDNLSETLGVPYRSLLREIRSGRLLAATRCGKVFVTGDAVLKWLAGKSDKGGEK